MRMQPENQGNNTVAGLYIHVPFCIQKCPYCDFYSVTDLSKVKAFVQALQREISLTKTYGLQFDTIYLGGGTPSVLNRGQIEEILKSVYSRFSFSQDIEITIEVNPGTLFLNSLEAFIRHGINRINIGIQSFYNQNLRFLQRIHSAQQACEAIEMTRKAGVENLGLDLIYGLPNQSRKYWLKDLKKAISYEPEHISCYMLTYEQGTLLHEWRQQGRFTPLDEDMVRRLFEDTISFLKEAGYAQYEISNFSRKKAFRSRHNQKYWSHAPYVGLGPSAHSFIRPMRWWNYHNLKDYLQVLESGLLPIGNSEDLTPNQLMLESIFLGLRTSSGIETLRFKKEYGIDFSHHFSPILERLQAQNLLSVSDERCVLTLEGMIFSDTIAKMFAEFIAELSDSS
ncbi:MAG: radical SAM family heme chaperone HemW [Deltaproteobacteria bacterium]|nr:radical SAM family heme chaperone HemW [Deltaproteobacteria bacterium]